MKNWLTLAAIGLGTLTAVVVAQSNIGSNTPSRLKAAGELVFCTEVGYPPFEFFPEGSNKPSGFDIDLGNELALRLGVQPRWENVGFDGIIASLQSKKCDAIIAGLGATDKRREQVDFVMYLQNNRALVVRKGNPKKVSSFDALCGLTIGAQIGSANYDDMLKRAETCKANGKAEMSVKSFKDNAALKLSLLTNQIDAYNTAAANAAIDIKASKGMLEIGTISDSVNMIGIATRKDDRDLTAALEARVKQMHGDGTMNLLLRKWGLQSFRLKGM
jgi:polar amino acid transport system substrate-binding protein